MHACRRCKALIERYAEQGTLKHPSQLLREYAQVHARGKYGEQGSYSSVAPQVCARGSHRAQGVSLFFCATCVCKGQQ